MYLRVFWESIQGISSAFLRSYMCFSEEVYDIIF